jgi:hypothetical protein
MEQSNVYKCDNSYNWYDKTQMSRIIIYRMCNVDDDKVIESTLNLNQSKSSNLRTKNDSKQTSYGDGKSNNSSLRQK